MVKGMTHTCCKCIASSACLQRLLEPKDCHRCKAGPQRQKPARSRLMLEHFVQLHTQRLLCRCCAVIEADNPQLFQHCIACLGSCSTAPHCKAQYKNSESDMGPAWAAAFIILLHCTLHTHAQPHNWRPVERCCGAIKHSLKAHQTDLSIRGSIT